MRFMTRVVRILGFAPMYFSSAFLIPCVVVLPWFEVFHLRCNGGNIEVKNRSWFFSTVLFISSKLKVKRSFLRLSRRDCRVYVPYFRC